VKDYFDKLENVKFITYIEDTIQNYCIYEKKHIEILTHGHSMHYQSFPGTYDFILYCNNCCKYGVLDIYEEKIKQYAHLIISMIKGAVDEHICYVSTSSIQRLNIFKNNKIKEEIEKILEL